jgi:hypothetical protein
MTADAFDGQTTGAAIMTMAAPFSCQSAKKKPPTGNRSAARIRK